MFESIKSNRISESIIYQIRQAIFEGKLRIGDKLSSEEKLMQEFGVSRATLRAALHSLEVLGFIEIKKGKAGGAFIIEIDPKKARDFFINFLHFRNLSLRDLFEVRKILEPYMATKAAKSVNEDNLKKLKEIIEKSHQLLENGTENEFHKYDIEFHRVIGNATQNPILIFITEFVENLLLEVKSILTPNREISKKVLEGHKSIYNAISEGNIEEA